MQVPGFQARTRGGTWVDVKARLVLYNGKGRRLSRQPASGNATQDVESQEVDSPVGGRTGGAKRSLRATSGVTSGTGTFRVSLARGWSRTAWTGVRCSLLQCRL